MNVNDEWSAGCDITDPEYGEAAINLVMRWMQVLPHPPPNVSLAMGHICGIASQKLAEEKKNLPHFTGSTLPNSLPTKKRQESFFE